MEKCEKKKNWENIYIFLKKKKKKKKKGRIVV